MSNEHLNIGYFPSIPWIPYYVTSLSWPGQLRECESSGVRALAESGQLDVTPMSTVDWFALGGDWKRLANWGIAFRGRAGSVLFFSNTPIEQLHEADIAICDETTTSVRVLQALLQGKYGLGIGRWRRNVDVSDADTPRLLIQNQAVDELHRNRFRYVYDIGREWWDWQGTPIVPAVWVHRAGLAPEQVQAMQLRLEEAVAQYRGNPQAAIAAHKAKHGWGPSVAAVQELHKNFEYDLGEETRRGIERMRLVLPKRVAGFEATRADR